jgi:hypothetical protein
MPKKTTKTKTNGRPNYYVITKQLPGEATLFGIPGDPGALIDGLKLYNVPPHRKDQLIRLYIQPFKGSTTWECKCGVKFDSEGSRQGHIHRRHLSKGGIQIKDFADCSEEEKARIIADIDHYDTSPADFRVPDPEDRAIAAQEKRLFETMDWEKTAASNQ